MALEVWLIRHAETEWSKAGKHTGLTDIPLTDQGRAHAATLPGRLAGKTFAAVFVSPLQRARETATLAGLGDQAQVRDDLVEYDYGEYEGITTDEIRRARPGWSLWRDGVPGGEQPDDVGARADRVIAEALDHRRRRRAGRPWPRPARARRALDRAARELRRTARASNRCVVPFGRRARVPRDPRLEPLGLHA